MEKAAYAAQRAAEHASSTLLVEVVTRGLGKEPKAKELTSLAYGCFDMRNEYAFCIFSDSEDSDSEDGCLFCGKPYTRQ